MKICMYCKKEIKNFGTKYCSYNCTYKDRLNGKEIECKNCGKKFYKSNSKLSINKFCSWQCYIDFQNNIKCKLCGQLKIKYKQTKYCFDCYIELQRQKDKERKINKQKTNIIKKYKCFYCKKDFIKPSWYSSIKYCSKTCFYLDQKEKRIGRNNPNWKGGFRSYDSKHLRRCAEYKQKFLDEHRYLYCELCGVSNAIRCETHHIIFASEAPKHKELHNDKNLILLCIGCHNKLHKHKSLRKYLVQNRDLNELFKGKFDI